MTWLAILAGAKSALSWLLGLFKRYPWQIVCLALALGFGITVDKLQSAKAEIKAEQAGRKADRAEWDRKVALAKAAEDKARKDAQETAIEADTTHDALLADNAGLERYIADHRVSAKACAADPARSGEGGAAGVPQEPAALPRVEVSEDALKVCDQNYAYARAAFDWGQGLVAKGLAEE